MATILIERVKVNSNIARYRRNTSTALTTIELGETRRHFDEISKYSYEHAIRIIRRDSTLAVGREV